MSKKKTKARKTRKKPESLEQIARDIGLVIKQEMPEGVGFALLIFDLGAGGTMTYMSNAQRTDMIAALKELVGNLERTPA